MKNQFVWVDFPVLNLDRAIKFYSSIINAEVKKVPGPGFEIGLFPHAETNVSGCLVESSEIIPAQNGPLVYLDVEGRIDLALKAVRTNGGKVLQEKHPIGQHGYRAIILDSEGNRVALHSLTA